MRKEEEIAARRLEFGEKAHLRMELDGLRASADEREAELGGARQRHAAVLEQEAQSKEGLGAQLAQSRAEAKKMALSLAQYATRHARGRVDVGAWHCKDRTGRRRSLPSLGDAVPYHYLHNGAVHFFHYGTPRTYLDDREKLRRRDGALVSRSDNLPKRRTFFSRSRISLICLSAPLTTKLVAYTLQGL